MPRFGYSPDDPIKRRSGAYLPHWTLEGATYAVTFRLHDSLPASVVERWRVERLNIIRRAEAMDRTPSALERDRLAELNARRIEEHLDRGEGACWMNVPAVADIVLDAMMFFDRARYDLVAWCVMPNHVHAVLRPLSGFTLSSILHSWKGFTGSEANRLLRRQGVFWQPESYDHLVRGPADLDNQIRYVLNNPTAAGLANWKWVGCRDAPAQPETGR